MDKIFDGIADGLAETGYAVVDGFLTLQEVEAILGTDDFKNSLTQFKRAGIGKSQGHQVNEAIRGDQIQWLDKDTAARPLQVYLNRLQALMEYLNQALYLSLKDYEVHMTIYPAGTFYKRHLDQFRRDDHRKLSVICYLNKDWELSHGGQLRMYPGDATLDVLPEAGRLVCFRSDQIEHEVLPANRERMSVTGWLLDKTV